MLLTSAVYDSFTLESICSFLAARTLELESAAYLALDELTSLVIVISHLLFSLKILE